MKKIVLIFISALLILTLVACGAGTSGEPDVPNGTDASGNSDVIDNGDTPDDVQPVEHTEGERALSALPDGAVAYAPAQAPDFLSEDLQKLYKAASVIRSHYEYPSPWGMSGGSYTDDMGMMYDIDGAFENYDQYRVLLENTFTEEYIQYLESLGMITAGADGSVNVIMAGKGSNIYYLDSTFELVSESDTEIVFNIIGRYNEYAEYGTIPPVSDSDYYQTYPITIKSADGEWRFDNFELPEA